MKLKHRVNITVSRPGGYKTEVLQGGSMTIRSGLLRFLLGEKLNVLVISPGDSVESVEIREVPEDAQQPERRETPV